MTDGNDIPPGTYSLQLGSGFKGSDSRRNNSSTFHTLRYDFKPSSVANETETYIAYGSGGDVHVAVPGESDHLTVFKGSKKEAKPKECLLFFDSATKTFRLEKISTNIQVKKTRDLDQGTESAIRNGIERLRTTSQSQPEPEVNQRSRHESSSSSSSSSESGSGSDSSSDDDDDETKLLDLFNASNPNQKEEVRKPAPAPTAPPPPASSSLYESSQRNNCGAYGLALSESSDDD